MYHDKRGHDFCYDDITGWLQIARGTMLGSLTEVNSSLIQFSLSSATCGATTPVEYRRGSHRNLSISQLFKHLMKLLLFSACLISPFSLKYLSWKLGTSELNSKKPASLLPVIFIPPHFRSPTWQWYYIHTYILHTTYHFIRLINFYPGERLNAPIIFRELQPEWRKTF